MRELKEKIFNKDWRKLFFWFLKKIICFIITFRFKDALEALYFLRIHLLYKGKMKTLDFSYNWNNKLDCKCFTTIRLSDRYCIGDEYKIILTNKKVPLIKGVAKIIDIKEFYLHQLNSFIAALDTGYSVPECKKIIQRMYKNTDFEKKQLKLILLLKINSNEDEDNNIIHDPAVIDELECTD